MICAHQPTGVVRRLMGIVVLASVVGALMLPAQAHDAQMHGTGGKDGHAPSAFVATNTKSFSQLMGEAMSVMEYGMTNAPMDSDPDHDFAAMMIPHHQGAIDMAKVELLYGTDPLLRRLAQEIIVTQGSEIAVMQLQLKKRPGGQPAQH